MAIDSITIATTEAANGSDLVSGLEERESRSRDLASTEKTDAVNAGIVHRAGEEKVVAKPARRLDGLVGEAGSSDKSSRVFVKREARGPSTGLADEERASDSAALTDSQKTQHLKAYAANAAMEASDESDELEGLGDIERGRRAVFSGSRNARSLALKASGPQARGRAAALVAKRARTTKEANAAIQKMKAQAKSRGISAQKKQEVAAKRAVKKAAGKRAPLIGIKAAGAASPVIGGVALGVAAFVLALILFESLIAVIAGAEKKDIGGLEGNEAIVAAYLLDKGLEPLHVAAIMGNIEAESGFNPALIEAGSRVGHGLCQWGGDGVRLEGLRAYAASKEKDWTDIGVQLDYLWAEMTGEGEAKAFAQLQSFSYRHDAFVAIGDLSEAVYYFGRKFERPNEYYAHWDRRIESANRYYILLTVGTGESGSGIVRSAMAKLGCVYVWGATGPNTFDCSGLVQWAFAQNGLSISRTTYTQIKQCKEVTAEEAMPGDLVFCNYSSPGVPEHVCIYMGDGMVIHAPQTGDVVKISPITNWSDAGIWRFVG